MKVKSLAELKRTLKVGMQLKLVRHDLVAKGGLKVVGNLGTTTIKPKIFIGQVREVASATATHITLATPQPDGSLHPSYLDWPKANRFRPTENGFEIDLNDDGKFTEAMGYEFVQEEPCAAATNQHATVS